MKIKRYVLFVWYKYYPGGGWCDYVDSFNNIDEAKFSIQRTIKGRNTKGDLFYAYIYDENVYDCYQLIDLHKGENVDLFDKPLESYIK